MKFERITNEEFGAKRAGYRIDFDAELQCDDAALADVRKDRPGYADNMSDSLYDMDGDLFRGDDGNYYVVVFDLGKTPAVPVFWHRVVK